MSREIKPLVGPSVLRNKYEEIPPAPAIKKWLFVKRIKHNSRDVMEGLREESIGSTRPGIR
jgi:hypothetical protein